jgi:A/G-specific adenine glycosylase
MDAAAFRELIWTRAHELYREMPWREEPSFYHVLVSEIMLQQTQVSRVLVKFSEFMQAFPCIEALAAAPLADVLRAWQGLGYNRRAKYLHEAARQVVAEGQPTTLAGLMALPGIGRNTAAALINYVYEVPTPYIETNIRSIYLHHFFDGEVQVSDADILRRVEETFDDEHPRQWCWALMDYGTWLKSLGGGKLVSSKHYRKQSPLTGSVREMRGRIVTALSEREYSVDTLATVVEADGRFASALDGLMRDGLIQRDGAVVHLTKH